MAVELTAWKHSAEPYAGKHKVLAIITCPSCKQEWILSSKIHQVSREGSVTPSVVCPCNDCNFHEFVTLKNWTFPEWFIEQTMNSFIADIQSGGPNSQPRTKRSMSKLSTERLRAAVVEAAKEWSAEQKRISELRRTAEIKWRLRYDADGTLIEAVDALTAFEAENKIGVDHETS